MFSAFESWRWNTSPLPVLNFPFGSYLRIAKMQNFIPTRKTAFGFAVVAGLLAALLGLYVQKGKKEEIFSCREQKYMTEIVSIDPLVIYINDFVSQSEASQLVSLGFFFLFLSFLISQTNVVKRTPLSYLRSLSQRRQAPLERPYLPLWRPPTICSARTMCVISCERVHGYAPGVHR